MSTSTNVRIAARIRRKRGFATRHPLLSRCHIVLFAAFGWSYLILTGCLAVVAIITLAASSMISIRAAIHGDSTAVAIALLTTIGLTFVLWITFRRATRYADIPSGIIIREIDAPRLFSCLERICLKLRVRPMRRVLLTEEFNAAITTVPRFAGVAGARTYLEIGLPLLHATAPEHFDAILAHEIGHLSGRLNRFSSWLYSWNLKWKSLAENEDDFIVAPFARWYSRRTGEISHALLESLELEADRLAREAVGRRTRTESLILTEIRGRMLNRVFYPSLRESMTREPRPPEDFHTRLKDFLSRPLDPLLAAGHLREALAEQPEPRSTHPTLRQKLESLGVIGSEVADEFGLLPPSPRTTAAQYFLDTREQELVWLLSASWKHRITDLWMSEYRDAMLRESVLYDLRRKDEHQNLTDAELWRMARLAEEFQGRREAFGLFLRYLESHRDEPRANFAFGRILMEENEESGIPYLEFAMEADPFLITEGCSLVCRYLYRNDLHNAATPYERRASKAALRLTDAIDERRHVSWNTALLPHNLSRAQHAALLGKLGDVDELERAWLARIDVRNFPDKPAFLMIARPVAGLGLNAEDCMRLAEWIDMEDHCLVIPCEGIAMHILSSRISRLAGGCLYRRGEPLSLSETH